MHNIGMNVNVQEEKIIIYLKKFLPRPRFIHSLAVMRMAGSIAEHYGKNKQHARLAGLLHDISRDLSIKTIIMLAKQYKSVLYNDRVLKMNPRLLHGFASAVIARKKFNIKGADILHAVAYHTIACKNMSIFDKIIYLADLTASDRRYKQCKVLRRLVMKNIDAAMKSALRIRIEYVLAMRWMLHPNSVYALNELLEK